MTIRAIKLYEQLERDFVTQSMTDDWAQYMDEISDYLTESFKQRSMGLVCDHTELVNKVYTAVFASTDVMKAVLSRAESDIMLFVHHPASWDIRTKELWQQMDRTLLGQFKDRRISVFNFHVPLDNFGQYSTSVCLAGAVGIAITKPFFDYFGAKAAVFGMTPIAAVEELSRFYAGAMGHHTSLYRYGTGDIRDGLVAVAAGGGNIVGVHEEIVAAGCNVLLTGITVKNVVSSEAHEYAEKHGINILGGTHYSNEKPACQAMCRYFESLGLSSEFIEGTPVLEDL
jgi:putative NIF3 family GTP cyclohydrolase 1 type 2